VLLAGGRKDQWITITETTGRIMLRKKGNTGHCLAGTCTQTRRAAITVKEVAIAKRRVATRAHARIGYIDTKQWAV
jgi:hypothetical protein